ncbi:MAG: type 4a pilus biogenesis protein PilO, partial [Myxococcales bacterium]|nr:type 4a pilus biogenesis protein PilO [Myxococcales bacterium]
MKPDLSSLLKLSLPKKIAILLGLQLAIGAAYYYALLQPKHIQIQGKSAELEKLLIRKEEQEAIASDLPRFRDETARLQADLERVLNQLPNRAEIPNLMRAITEVGEESGLEFVRFRPASEAPKEFYAAVPVELEVIGGYHQIATFFDRVGKLPRIVTISDIDISELHNKGGELTLSAKCVATTYKFLEESERPKAADASATDKGKGKGKGKKKAGKKA